MAINTKDSLKSINALASLTDSRYYGNYKNSLALANENSGIKRTAGFSEIWNMKNIYGLAGNVWEWTSRLAAKNSLFVVVALFAMVVLTARYHTV